MLIRALLLNHPVIHPFQTHHPQSHMIYPVFSLVLPSISMTHLIPPALILHPIQPSNTITTISTRIALLPANPPPQHLHCTPAGRQTTNHRLLASDQYQLAPSKRHHPSPAISNSAPPDPPPPTTPPIEDPPLPLPSIWINLDSDSSSSGSPNYPTNEPPTAQPTLPNPPTPTTTSSPIPQATTNQTSYSIFNAPTPGYTHKENLQQQQNELQNAHAGDILAKKTEHISRVYVQNQNGINIKNNGHNSKNCAMTRDSSKLTFAASSNTILTRPTLKYAGHAQTSLSKHSPTTSLK
jgi:hypothetical protein